MGVIDNLRKLAEILKNCRFRQNFLHLQIFFSQIRYWPNWKPTPATQCVKLLDQSKSILTMPEEASSMVNSDIDWPTVKGEIHQSRWRQDFHRQICLDFRMCPGYTDLAQKSPMVATYKRSIIINFSKLARIFITVLRFGKRFKSSVGNTK